MSANPGFIFDQSRVPNLGCIYPKGQI